MKSLLPRALLAGGLIIAIATAIYFRDQISVTALENWIAQAGTLAVFVFLLAYALATVLFLPGAVFTLAGGALFGPLWGTFYNLTGSTMGAVIAFLIARYLASEWVERTAGGPLKKIIAGVEQEGWQFLAFARLMPISPFNVLNYAFGLTRIKFSHYAIVTYVCMLPGTVAFTYIGFAGREAFRGEREGLIRNACIALALLAVVTCIPLIVKRLRAGSETEKSGAFSQDSGH